MKRVISGLFFGIILLLIAGLGMYYWVGMQIADTIAVTSEHFSKEDEGLKFRIISHDNSLFDSTTVQEVEINPAKMSYYQADGNADVAPFKLMLQHTIYHGPFAFSAPGADPAQPVAAIIETELKPDNPFTQVLQSFTGKQKPFQARTIVHFDQSSEVEVTVAPVNYTSADKSESIKWTGLKGQFNYNPKYQDAGFSFHAGGLSAQDQDSLVVVDGISGLFKGQLGNGSGDVTLNYKVDRFYTKSGDAEDTSAEGFQFKAGSKTNAQKLTTLFAEGSIKKVQAEGENYGPGNISLAIRRLDATILQSVQSEIQKAQQELTKQGLPPDMLPMAIQPIIMKALPNLLKKQPEIELSKLHLTTPQGEIDGNLKISIDTLGQAEAAQNPFALINAIRADANIKCPGELITSYLKDDMRTQITEDAEISGEEISPEEIDMRVNMMMGQQLEMFAQQGYLVVNGDQISSTARLNQGQLELNGRTMPLMALMGGGQP